MDRKRVLHNAKARQSTAGSRKKGKKPQKTKSTDQYDPNAAIIVPKSEEQKELDRRERLRQEVHNAYYPNVYSHLDNAFLAYCSVRV